MILPIRPNLHFVIISIAAGFIIGWFLVSPQEMTSQGSAQTGGISIGQSHGDGQAQQGSNNAASMLGSAAIGPKKGDSDQGLQAGARSVDELIGNAEIKVK